MTEPLEALTVAEVCERLKLHRNTVYRLIRRGRLRAKKINGRGNGQRPTYRVTAAALHEYLGQRRVR